MKIQKGRLAGIDRENRLCKCETDIQTLNHVIFHCPLTEVIRQSHNIIEENLLQFFENENYTRSACILRAIEKIVL